MMDVGGLTRSDSSNVQTEGNANVQHTQTGADFDEAAAEFYRVRPRLFGIAYRMLGTVVDAEDVVQEAWMRWQKTDRAAIRDTTAFLATIATRLAINAATSARARREVYVGPWLPEPVPTAADPTLGAERAEALDLAVLVLLERLSPTERAVYVLREAFDYPFTAIAEVVETSEANARQLARRARVRLTEERHVPVDSRQRSRLLGAFLAAAQSGDLKRLESLLLEDAVSYSDGGGVVTAARLPIFGRERVARFMVGLAAKHGAGHTFETVEINGHSGMLMSENGQPIAILSIEATTDGIKRLFLVNNPQKLVLFRTTS
jgi:RNA polymerase sigma-70 factor (ECF subfamily)